MSRHLLPLLIALALTGLLAAAITLGRQPGGAVNNDTLERIYK